MRKEISFKKQSSPRKSPSKNLKNLSESLINNGKSFHELHSMRFFFCDSVQSNEQEYCYFSTNHVPCYHDNLESIRHIHFILSITMVTRQDLPSYSSFFFAFTHSPISNSLYDSSVIASVRLREPSTYTSVEKKRG